MSQVLCQASTLYASAQCIIVSLKCPWHVTFTLQARKQRHTGVRFAHVGSRTALRSGHSCGQGADKRGLVPPASVRWHSHLWRPWRVGKGWELEEGRTRVLPNCLALRLNPLPDSPEAPELHFCAGAVPVQVRGQAPLRHPGFSVRTLDT